MRRNRIRRFFQQKQYAIASLVLFIAIAAMTGVYLSNRITGQKQENKLAQEEAELNRLLDGQNDYTARLDNDGMNLDSVLEEEEDVTSVTSVIRPREIETDTAADKETKQAGQESQENQENQEKETGWAKEIDAQPNGQDNAAAGQESLEGTEKKQETAAQAKASSANPSDLHFSPDTDLGWPLQGDVILNYSMDQTIYFATLEQYKYNPALIIAGKVNDPVKAAAAGRITDISANEETGVTVTMDLGDGYSAVYGQLKEVLYNEGAAVESGNAIGYIAEPTKYYSVEGSNLYFELLKDNEPVNPMQYIQ